MQKRHRRPYGPFFQLFVLKRHPQEVIVNCYRYLALIHIEQHTQNSFLLELLAPKGLPIGPIAVSQLPHGVVGPAKGVVAEGSLEVEFPILRDSYFDLILRPCIGHYLPVVDALIETLVGDYCSEKIGFLLQENRTILGTYLDHIRGVVGVPGEGLDRTSLPPDDVPWTHALLLRDHCHLLLLSRFVAQIVCVVKVLLKN